MKTIAVPRSPRSIFGTVLVLGGLFALYYYRKQGGKVSTLVTGAVDTFGKVRERVAATAVDATDAIASRRPSKEISTSPEAMDSIAAN